MLSYAFLNIQVLVTTVLRKAKQPDLRYIFFYLRSQAHGFWQLAYQETKQVEFFSLYRHLYKTSTT